MSPFRTFTTGVKTLRSFEGKDLDGNTIRIVEWIRPTASTAGIRFLSLWRNGVGVSTEQFGGYRLDLIDAEYRSVVEALTAAAQQPQRPGLVKGAKEAAPVPLFDQNGVQMYVVRGKAPVYRLYHNGVQIGDDIRAGANWQQVKRETLARAKALAGVA